MVVGRRCMGDNKMLLNCIKSLYSKKLYGVVHLKFYLQSRSHVMCSYYTQKHTYQKAKGTFGCDKYVYYLDCGDSIEGYVNLQTYRIVLIKYMHFYRFQ